MTATTSRRRFLRGMALASATAGAGVGTVAVAAAVEASEPAPHPDASLFAAEADAERAEAKHRAAREAYRAASVAARREHGLPPDELLASAEDIALCRAGAPFRFISVPYAHLRPTPCPPGLWQNPKEAWSGRGLRLVISRAVEKLGPAGRTPRLLRRWRQLLPAADAFDRRVKEAVDRHRVVELHDASIAAEKAWHAALVRRNGITAVTPEGLAVHVRTFSESFRDKKKYLPLLLSAAAVAGVTLDLPEMKDEEGEPCT